MTRKHELVIGEIEGKQTKARIVLHTKKRVYRFEVQFQSKASGLWYTAIWSHDVWEATKEAKIAADAISSIDEFII